MDAKGKTPLHYSTSLEIIALLVKCGADPDARDNDGWTPTMLATRRKDKAALRYVPLPHAFSFCLGEAAAFACSGLPFQTPDRYLKQQAKVQTPGKGVSRRAVWSTDLGIL